MKHISICLISGVFASLLLFSCSSSDRLTHGRPMAPEKGGEPVKPVYVEKAPVVTPTVQPPDNKNDGPANAFGTNSFSGAVSYIVDGEAYSGEVRTEEDLTSLYIKLLGYAKLGHSILVSASKDNAHGEKNDILNFSSPSEKEVTAWATKMIKKGYSITIDYDKTTRTYQCTAYKSK